MTRSKRPSAGLVDRWAGQSVFLCGFRPFFLLTASSALLFMAAWLWALHGGKGMPQVPGGMLLWHAHELVYGFGTAAIAGFVLTAIPEFTGTRPVGGRVLLRLALLWLAARAAYVLAAFWPSAVGLWPAAACNLSLWAYLLVQVFPPLWRDPERKHIGFGWALGILALLQSGYFVSAAVAGNPLRWLYAAVGALMVLIIIAASRVSMSVLNNRVESGRRGVAQAATAVYLARPPRRYLAQFTIALCTAVEFLLGPDTITAWTALAAAAAMLNLLNDWHIGRALFTRWALMLYATYWLIALGYAALGAAWLGAPITASAGRHLLMTGAMALSIFAIMNIAGRIHAGLWLDRRRWLPLAALALVAAALLRTAAGYERWMPSYLLGITAAGVLWMAAFATYLWYAAPVLLGPRADGQDGCAGPLPDEEGAHGGCG